MQLFRLHVNPRKSARLLPDKYTYNQIRESAQFMLTALEMHGVDTHYEPTHESHPITQWASESIANWLDAYAYTGACHEEYQERYGYEKSHKSWRTIQRFYDEAISNLPNERYTIQPCAFKDKYKVYNNPSNNKEVAENYRNYVQEAKSDKSWFSFERRK